MMLHSSCFVTACFYATINTLCCEAFKFLQPFTPELCIYHVHELPNSCHRPSQVQPKHTLRLQQYSTAILTRAMCVSTPSSRACLPRRWPFVMRTVDLSFYASMITRLNIKISRTGITGSKSACLTSNIPLVKLTFATQCALTARMTPLPSSFLCFTTRPGKTHTPSLGIEFHLFMAGPSNS